MGRSELVLRKLGPPDLVIDFAEGDSLWMYAVRVWPWNEAVGLNVYNGHVFAGSRWHEADFFFEPLIQKRTEKESADMKAFLALQERTGAN